MNVYKTIFTVTVLSAEPIISGVELDRVVQEMNDGEFIGQVEQGESKLVPPAKVKAALEAIGNDGTFFDDVFEDN